MATLEQYETTDVVICGCGPTGAMLSAYLGQMNFPHIVLEKDGDITTDPRGIALDEDGIRLLQGVGLYGSIYTDIGTCRTYILLHALVLAFSPLTYFRHAKIQVYRRNRQIAG